MENNSYTNVMDTSKPATPPVYTCGLCSKEFLYYRDLAVHERMHLEQISGSLQVGSRPPYQNRPPQYTNPPASATSATPLESFDKLVQPFRRDSEIPVQMPISTAPDKSAQIYRSNTESRNVLLNTRGAPIDSHGINMDLRGLPVDNRAVPLDTRPVTLANRSSQPVDTRAMMTNSRNIPVDARSVPYNSSSYMDPGINTSMYSGELANKIPTSTPPAFPSPQASVRPEHYGSIENRTQGLPKLDSQIFSKPEPYYSLPKSHYSIHGGEEKSHSNYAPQSQYGPISKLLGQQPAAYYSQPMSGQPQAKYDMEKLNNPSAASLGYYNQPVMSQADPKLDRRQPSPSPKQTLYYGQPQAQSHHATVPANSHFPGALNKPSPVLYQSSRDMGNKVEMGRPYQPGHVSPHMTYPDTYKASSSQAQPQGFPAVPSQPPPAQHNYPYYKPAPEKPAINVSSTSKPSPVEALGLQEYKCYICHAPFPNMNDLSEHMKIHARENIAKEIAAQHGQQTSVAQVGGNHSPASTMSYPGVPDKPHIQPGQLPSTSSEMAFKLTKDNLTCRICDKTFQKLALLVEHVKTHKVQNAEHFECKVCKKKFPTHSDCACHEALHQKEVKIYYCEICKKDFTFMGNYLHHMQVEHNKRPLRGSTSLDKAKNKSLATSPPDNMEGENVVASVEMVVACQVCEMNMPMSKLVDHLRGHPVYTCDKCECSFSQKLEYVEHLMEDHWKELAESSENSEGEREKADRTRQQSEERDSGLEEDHDKEKDEVATNATSKAKDIALKVKQVAEASAITDIEKEKRIKEMKNLKENRDKKLLQEESSIDKAKKLKFSCSKCDESFERKTELAQHVESHRRDPCRIYCEVCNISYNHRERGYLTYHMKQHTDSDMKIGKNPEKLMCIVCYKEIKREKFISHVVSQHTQYSCDICQWSYSSESSLFNHMKKIHSNSKVKYVLKKGGGIEVQHKTGPVVYKKLKDIAQGDEDDTGSLQNKFACRFCNKVFTKRSSIENHIKTHNAKPSEQHIICELCSTSFSSKGTYFYHVLHDHENNGDVKPLVDKDSPVKVEEQSLEQKTVTVLNPETGNLEEKVVDYIKGTEIEASELNTGSKDMVSDIVYCQQCNMCSKKDALCDHMKEHAFFHCELCRFSFTKKVHFLNHQRLIHVDDVITWEIEKAEAEERAINKATEAGKRKRTDLIKLLSCPVCSGDFRQDKYIEHIKTHKKVTLKCRFCAREFSRKNILLVHEKSHERITHVENELPFARNCPVCNAGIVSRVNYVQHVCQHLNHKPFACKTCGKEFIGEKNLENHKRVYHDSNLRVYWTQDGEGLRFDMRTGRYGEVVSDYLTEIKELNELLRENNKPAIWINTPKKMRSRGRSRKLAEDELEEAIEEEEDGEGSDEEEGSGGEEESETGKLDTSDEDYIPEKKPKGSTEERDDCKPAAKKKKKKIVYTADDETTSEEDKKTTSKTKRKAALASKKATAKLRKQSKRNKNKPRNVSGGERVLRPRKQKDKESSDSESEDSESDDSISYRRRKRKSTTKLSESNISPKRRKSTRSSSLLMSPDEIEKYRLKPGQSYRNCPLCEQKLSGRAHYADHLRTHTGEKPFVCPVCSISFNKEYNMYVHIKGAHKDYNYTYPQGLANEPLTTSTPLKTTKLTIKLSPLQLDDSTIAGNSPRVDLDSSKNTLVDYICRHCGKRTNNSWNLSRHEKTHKKDLKPEEESKPFSCKTCSESFKKKRDLYIHTKVHTGNTVDPQEDVDLSKTESEMNDTENTSLSGSVHESDLSHSRNLSNNTSDISKNGNNGSISASKTSCPSGVNPDPINNNQHMKVNSSESMKQETSVSDVMDNDTTSSNIPQTKTTAASHSLGNNGVSDMKDETVSIEMDDCENSSNSVSRRNSNSDLKKLSDSDMEDKSKSTKTPPPVKKMTSESALSKWKMKVRSTLSSQLELNAAKKQEELANPEIARVKEKLAIKSKSEQKNFECRICGIAFDLENLFREHMDVHLNEAPPYCALCDIYFMAIYPKRRLIEHNRKKHPENQS